MQSRYNVEFRTTTFTSNLYKIFICLLFSSLNLFCKCLYLFSIFWLSKHTSQKNRVFMLLFPYFFRHSLPMYYEAKISDDGKSWTGQAIIPGEGTRCLQQNIINRQLQRTQHLLKYIYFLIELSISGLSRLEKKYMYICRKTFYVYPLKPEGGGEGGRMPYRKFTLFFCVWLS